MSASDEALGDQSFSLTTLTEEPMICLYRRLHVTHALHSFKIRLEIVVGSDDEGANQEQTCVPILMSLDVW